LDLVQLLQIKDNTFSGILTNKNVNLLDTIVTHDTKIASMQQKTDRMVLSGSILTFPSMTTNIQLNQNLDLNTFSLTNVTVNSFVGYGMGAQIYIKNSSTLAIYANLTGNNTTGSVFDFRSVKDGAYNSAKLSAVDLDLNGRTISNSPTITGINTSISNIEAVNTTQTNNIATNASNIATNTGNIATATSVNTTQTNSINSINSSITNINSTLATLNIEKSSTGNINVVGMSLTSLNVWLTFNLVGGVGSQIGKPSTNASGNGLRLSTAGVYKLTFNYSYKAVTGGVGNDQTIFYTRINTTSSTTVYTPIDGSKLYSINATGDCANSSDYSSSNVNNPILYHASNDNDWRFVQYTRNNSSGAVRPNAFTLEVTFRHSSTTSDYFLQVMASRSFNIKNANYLLTYVTP
jgi:hypothetical protein